MKWTCGKCGFSSDLTEQSNQIAFCPECGSPAENTQDTGSHPNTEKPNYGSCPVCCSPILDGEESIECPDCKVLYHRECWEDNQGCATYGCKSSHSVDAHLLGKENSASCPWCFSLLPPKTQICPQCGKRTDGIPFPSNYEQNPWICYVQRNIKQICETLLNRLFLLLQDLVRFHAFLRPYIFHVFRSYRKSLMRYTAFGGRTGRKDFTVFVLISAILSFVLTVVPGNMYLAYGFWGIIFLPSLAIMIRRLHDTALSGWYIFAIPLLPFLLFVPTNDSIIENLKEKPQTKDENNEKNM